MDKVKIYRGLYDQFVLVSLPEGIEDPTIQGHLCDEIEEYMTDYGDREMLFHDHRLGLYEATIEWDGGCENDEDWIYLDNVKYIGE